jgi:UPF0755 protein
MNDLRDHDDGEGGFDDDGEDRFDGEHRFEPDEHAHDDAGSDPEDVAGDDGWVEVDEVDEWGQVLDEGADEYVRIPRQPSRAKRVGWILGAAVAVLVVFLGGLGLWLYLQINPAGGPGEPVTLEIVPGATVNQVADELAANDVITQAFIFRFYARNRGFDQVQAGTYDNLAENMSMGAVIDALSEGPRGVLAAGQITIPEGLRFTQVWDRVTDELPDLDEDELMAAFAQIRSEFLPEDATSIEGFLFPDTYRIEEGDEDDAVALVTQMTGRFDEVAQELGYHESGERVGMTPYDLVIIASIIEREAKIDEDRGKVSRVIYNRLAQGMPLEIDATLLYAIGHTETLLQSELETDTPYNTRMYPGLPPTPIAMPGRASMAAAIDPEPGPWLFYVLADTDDSHFFTDDFDEFLRVAQDARDRGIFE